MTTTTPSPRAAPPSTEVAGVRRRAFLEQSRRERLAAALWSVAWLTLFRCSPGPFHWWRTQLLRLFGARIGGPLWISPSVRVLFPWNLRIGSHVSVAHEVIINCMGPVTIGEHTRISQYTHIVAGTHMFQRRDMRILRCPVRIGERVWLAADAFVGPGVSVGDGVLLAARASAVHDLPPGQICAGEPARPVKPWTTRALPV